MPIMNIVGKVKPFMLLLALSKIYKPNRVSVDVNWKRFEQSPFLFGYEADLLSSPPSLCLKTKYEIPPEHRYTLSLQQIPGSLTLDSVELSLRLQAPNVPEMYLQVNYKAKVWEIDVGESCIVVPLHKHISDLVRKVKEVPVNEHLKFLVQKLKEMVMDFVRKILKIRV